MKILIYGGSFNPVHAGHAALLKAAIRQIKPDYTYIFTAWHSPFKQKTPVPFALRQNMAKAALAGCGGKIIFDDFEDKANRMVYTRETIKYIRAKYPGAGIYLLTGADCLNEIHTWQKAPYIFANAIIAAGARKGCDFAPKGFDFMLVRGSFPKASSSQIRLDIMQNGTLPKTVPPQAAAIIAKNKMYGLDMHRWLKANLSPKRYAHVKAVARAAIDLAARYKVDGEKAATAALLHDMAKGKDDKSLLKYALDNKLKIKDFKHAPHLLHAPASADMAKKIFNIKDKDILLAIERHTLGAADMSALQKIIFIADMCAKDRRPKEAAAVRQAAQKSLDDGVLAAMAVKLNFTIQTRKWLAPAGPKIWNKLVLKQKS